jgi:hypothetical protein
LERESAEGGALRDGAGELGRVLVLFSEDLKVLLLAVCPVLTLALAQLEQFLGRALEIELVLLVSDHLGEVSMGIAPVEVLDLGCEHGCGSSNGCGREGGEVSSQLAAGIVGSEVEALEDVFDELEGLGSW